MTRSWFTPGSEPSGRLDNTPAPEPTSTEPNWLPGVVGAVADILNGFNEAANIDFPLSTGNSDVMRWVERVANYSPWNDVFSIQQQESQLVVDIPYRNRYLFVSKVLGYQWVDNSQLRRINPIPHPYWTWMRAAKIGHVGVGWAGTRRYTAVGKTADYKIARFTIGFGNFAMSFLEDSQIAPNSGEEWKRNVVWAEKPTSQFLAAEGGAGVLKYAYPATMGLATGAAFRAPFGAIASQIRYDLTWKWVPYDFVFKGRIPLNLYRAMNKLNNATFANDFVKGTLLFDGLTITRYPAPFRFTQAPVYLCDIGISLLYFDPDRGLTAGTGSDIRGHNLMPNRKDNKWYPAVRPGADPSATPTLDDTNQLFAFVDFASLWKKPV